jgi:hypothetical protein
MKKITLYLCGKCGKEFRRPSVCLHHERDCKAQNCECCKHAYYEYGCEFRCCLLDNSKACKFEAKEMRM